MSAGRKKILWVDDEIEFFRSQITFLETRGYSVIPVFSGNEAIDLLNRKDSYCDIVLIDEKVDGVDSLVTTEAIRKVNSKLPIVLLTQNESERHKKYLSSNKINAILLHPVKTGQILSVCKKLLNNFNNSASQQTKEGFVRSYSEIRNLLSGNLKTKDYYKIYEKLVYWDLELENSGDEGLRQAFSGLKSDINIAFSNYVTENYGQWINGVGEPPVLGHKVIEKAILPLINNDNKCILIIISGMRFDQYLNIERLLSDLYKTKRQFFISTLPSAAEFSRSSFLAGELPRDVEFKYPGTLKEPSEGEIDFFHLENNCFNQSLSKNGINFSDQEPNYSNIDFSYDANRILSQIEACRSSQLISLIFDLNNHVSNCGFSTQELVDFKSNEYNLRLITDLWFQKSALFQVIQKMASKNYTVVITSDHGSVLCSRGTEIYNAGNLNENRRYKFGKDISADERRVVFLSDPSHFGLPPFNDGISCIMAKENFFFSYPEKYEFYQKEYHTSFQNGGISLEEVVMPLGIFQPK